MMSVILSGEESLLRELSAESKDPYNPRCTESLGSFALKIEAIRLRDR
jgi:hypothetical protein